MAAGRGVQPPCGATPTDPPYAVADQGPSSALWNESELAAARWSPPACLGWAGHTRLAAAVAGEFAFPGQLDDLLQRIGAFSRYPAIRYWSASHRDWRPLASDAGLLRHVGAGPDLPASAFRPGLAYDYYETDSAGRAIYRLTVRERQADRAVVATENVSPIRLLLLPLFDPGALQSVIFLDRTATGRWRFYQAMRVGAGGSLLALSAPASYLNRLIALYGYVAGVKVTRREQQPT